MRRLFNKANQSPAVPYQAQPAPEQFYDPPSSLTPGNGSRSYRQEDRGDYGRATSQNAASNRSIGAASNRGPYNTSDPARSLTVDQLPMRSGRRPKSGGTTAYPSYGEVQLDSNENRGGGHVSRPVAEPLEAVYHQKLPPRSSVPQPVHHSHSRSQSAQPSQETILFMDSQRQNSYQGHQSRVDHIQRDPLPNPFSSNQRKHQNERGLERQASLPRAGIQNWGISRRASQRTRGPHRDEYNESKPTRRPSLLYGIDSSVHGGYASVAMANAAEHESSPISDQNYDRSDDVIRPGTKYVDRYVDVRTPQSVAIGTGMDKMKKRLFGKRRKDERIDGEERERSSSEEWARVEPVPPASSEQYESTQKSGAERRADQGNGHTPWFSGKKIHHNSKAVDDVITSQIGNLCISDEGDWDWNLILALCNAMSRSEAASKEAAQALRKEFRYGEEDPKFRAIRLWAILCTRASDRFRLQVATKKFLEALEDLYTDKKTSIKLRGRLLLAWSMLAYEYQLDQDLHPITKMFNKIKPKDMPTNGIALDTSHELFSGSSFSGMQQSVPASLGQDIYHDHFSTPVTLSAKQQDLDLHKHDYTLLQVGATEMKKKASSQQSIIETLPSSEQEESLQDMPRLSDDIRRLHQECQVARGNVQLMTEALIEHGLTNDIVSEFAGRTQLSEDYITAQIPWASAQADRSRAERHGWVAAGGGDAEEARQYTREELLLQDLLETHEKLVAANGMIAEARDRQREEEEERRAIDQSIREQRIDRSTLVEESATGKLYSVLAGSGLAPPMEGPQASSSRSASPIPPVVRRPLPVPGVADASSLGNLGAVSMQNSSFSSKSEQLPLPPTLNSSQSAAYDNEFSSGNSGQSQVSKCTPLYRGGPRPMNDINVTAPSSVDDGSNAASNISQSYGQEDEDNDSIILTPVAPSAKALGKRRAMSIRESVSNDYINPTTLPNLINQVNNSMRLDSTQNEQALRARPPPALPNNHVNLQNYSSDPFYQ